MKIELLYFDGCPHYEPAVELVREVLAEGGSAATVEEVSVSDPSAARTLAFLGSPTIRVEGLDVEPAARSARDYGLSCRTYLVNGRREGLPSREMVRQAILETLSGAGEGTAAKRENVRWWAAGSIIAAIVSSFCCILPIVFALTGFSILGASALFDAWRPYLLAITFGLLGVAFYFAYRPAKRQCAPGSVCAIPAIRRSGRLILWVATAASILFAAFPLYSGAVAEFLLSLKSK